MVLGNDRQSTRNENLKAEKGIDASAPQIDETPMPSLRIMGRQFLILSLAILLHYLRKQHVPILGWRVPLVWEVVPTECLILSGLLVELAMRELGYRYGGMEMFLGIDH
ncbi:hypothetical protein EG329_012474 [Mollisiaceae sp. DMI_Dod_QoI]|nr:hypothetical protein EG329_012474 [Helotiales sp. DMI_Dod_QoI]